MVVRSRDAEVLSYIRQYFIPDYNQDVVVRYLIPSYYFGMSTDSGGNTIVLRPNPEHNRLIWENSFNYQTLIATVMKAAFVTLYYKLSAMLLDKLDFSAISPLGNPKMIFWGEDDTPGSY